MQGVATNSPCFIFIKVEIDYQNGLQLQSCRFLAQLRKTAELVRALAEQHPFQRPQIRVQFGSLSAVLFDEPLDNLPSTPSEYSLISRVKAKVNEVLDR